MNFDDAAKKWDTDKRIDRAKIISKEISDSIDKNKALTAMEFGCGTGLISFNIYDKFKDIILIDSSQGMIDVLNSKINEYKVDNMIPLKIDIFNKKSLDKTFDVIYNSMVLHHIKDTEAIIKRFYQLLNNEGYLCIVDLNEEDGRFHKKELDFDGHNGFNQEELRSILSNAGFKYIESKTFFYDKKIIDGEEVEYSLFIIKARK